VVVCRIAEYMGRSVDYAHTWVKIDDLINNTVKEILVSACRLKEPIELRNEMELLIRCDLEALIDNYLTILMADVANMPLDERDAWKVIRQARSDLYT